MRTSPQLVLSAATFGYHRSPTVTAVTFQLDAGQSFLIHGDVGSGATAIAHGLAGLADHLGGTATLADHPIVSAAQAGQVVFIPPPSQMQPQLTKTIRQVLTAAHKTTGRTWPLTPTKIRAQVTTLIERIGLTSYADQPLERLPASVQRVVAIAAAWGSAASLVIIMDPVAGLPVSDHRFVFAALNNLRHEQVLVGFCSHTPEPYLAQVDYLMHCVAGKLSSTAVRTAPTAAAQRPVVPVRQAAAVATGASETVEHLVAQASGVPAACPPVSPTTLESIEAQQRRAQHLQALRIQARDAQRAAATGAVDLRGAAQARAAAAARRTGAQPSVPPAVTRQPQNPTREHRQVTPPNKKPRSVWLS